MYERNDLDDAATNDGRTYVLESEQRPSAGVVEAVARATGTSPTSMRPLYDVIDPDGLDQLVEADATGGRRSRDVRVTFHYEGHEVTVYGDGRTVVSARDDDRW